MNQFLMIKTDRGFFIISFMCFCGHSHAEICNLNINAARFSLTVQRMRAVKVMAYDISIDVDVGQVKRFVAK